MIDLAPLASEEISHREGADLAPVQGRQLQTVAGETLLFSAQARSYSYANTYDGWFSRPANCITDTTIYGILCPYYELRTTTFIFRLGYATAILDVDSPTTMLELVNNAGLMPGEENTNSASW